MATKTSESALDEHARLIQIKEEYLSKNPFGFDPMQLQQDAEAISYFISFASKTIQY